MMIWLFFKTRTCPLGIDSFAFSVSNTVDEIWLLDCKTTESEGYLTLKFLSLSSLSLLFFFLKID